jgi:hypothetical protein
MRRATTPRDEAQVLRELRQVVRAAAQEVSQESEWLPTLRLLDDELGEGQPFFFKVAFASSSKSMSDASVVSS